MSFDPSKYLAEKGGQENQNSVEVSEFDPSAYLTEKNVALHTPSSSISAPSAALIGAQQGLTFGLSDELAGAIGAGLEATSEESMPEETKLDQIKRLYSEYRDRERARIEKAQTDQPVVSTVGDIAGGLLTPMGAFKALGGGIKGAAKVAAATGAVEAAGRTEQDLMSLEGAKEVGLGAGLSGALGAVAGKVASKFTPEKLAEKSIQASQEANLEALKSIGAKKTDFLKELNAKTSKRSGVENAKGTGQTLLDENLIKLKQNPVELNSELNSRLDDVFEKRIVPITQKLDKKLQKVSPDIFQKETLDLSARMLGYVEELEELNKLNPSGSAALVENARESAQEIISRLANSTSPNKMSEALLAKRQLSQILNESDWDKSEVSGAKDYLKKMVSELKNYSESLAQKVDPDLAKQLAEQNKVYGRLSDAKQIAIKDLAKESATSGLSIGDYFLGSVGGSMGGLAGGMAAIGAKKGVEKYTGKTFPELFSTYQALKKNKTAQSLAQRVENYGGIDKAIAEGSDTIAQKAITTTSALSDSTEVDTPYKKDRAAMDYVKTASPQSLIDEANKIRQQHGTSGEKLASMLEKVSQKDKSGRNALMFSILQDPANRKMLGLMEEN